MPLAPIWSTQAWMAAEADASPVGSALWPGQIWTSDAVLTAAAAPEGALEAVAGAASPLPPPQAVSTVRQSRTGRSSVVRGRDVNFKGISSGQRKVAWHDRQSP